MKKAERVAVRVVQRVMYKRDFAIKGGKLVQRRVALAVWLDHPRSARLLRSYGTLHYVSNLLKYAILYVKKDDAPAIMRSLSANRHVRKVELSPYEETVEAVLNCSKVHTMHVSTLPETVQEPLD